MTTYSIAETFTSIQGEGFYTGTPMYFIRLAGCNVGKPQPKATSPFVIVKHPEHTICSTFCGQSFLCDTDYRKNLSYTPEALVASIPEKILRICLTGGEPFMWDLRPLLSLLSEEHMIHIETSGTLPIPSYVEDYNCWITCSPKAGYLPQNGDFVAEWKLLVNEATPISVLSSFAEAHTREWNCDAVYLQPINGIHQADAANLKRCLDILKLRPDWHLSAQLHKYLGER